MIIISLWIYIYVNAEQIVVITVTRKIMAAMKALIALTCEN